MLDFLFNKVAGLIGPATVAKRDSVFLTGLLRKSKKVSDGHLIEIFATVKVPLHAKT